MKKILLLPACLLVMTILSQAQTKKSPLPPPPPPVPPKVEVTHYRPPTVELKTFYQQNPDVEKLYWKSEKDVVIVHKDKTEHVYNMKNKEDKAAFKTKYGNGHISMPPPPPKPATDQ